jgi:hypothetical protein
VPQPKQFRSPMPPKGGAQLTGSPALCADCVCVELEPSRDAENTVRQTRYNRLRPKRDLVGKAGLSAGQHFPSLTAGARPSRNRCHL